MILVGKIHKKEMSSRNDTGMIGKYRGYLLLCVRLKKDNE